MSRSVQIGQAVVDQFPVFNLDGYTKRSGESSFQATAWRNAEEQAAPITISEIGSTGEYKVEFSPADGGFWKVEVLVDYNKDIYIFEYTVDGVSIDDIYALVRRIAGLNHENITIDNTQYDANGQLLQARVRLFDNKDDCDAATDGGSETNGLLATYTLDTIWEAINQFKTFKQVLEE